MKLGIDVFTKDKANIIRKLRRLQTTHEVSDGGMYHEDTNYSQVHLDTDWDEGQLDAWLYQQKGINYVGTWNLGAYEEAADKAYEALRGSKTIGTEGD